MKYLIKNVYEIEIEIEADSEEDARYKQDDPEYQYSINVTMDQSGENVFAQYIDQMIFKVN